MTFFIHPQAEEELEQALIFYKNQQAGLEKRFIEAVEDAISRVCRNPLLYRKIDQDVRSADYCISLMRWFSDQIRRKSK